MKSLHLAQPHAIVVIGIPGSGKTTFVDKFAETFNAPRVSQKSMEDLNLPASAAKSAAKSQLVELVKTGATIIVDIDTNSRSARTELSQYLKSKGYSVLFIWVQTENDTAQQRYLKDKKKTAEDFARELRKFTQPHAMEKALVISGKHTYASQAKIVLKKISAPRTEMIQQKKPPVRGQITIR